jgi:class 3 adenylate cyclase
MSEPPPVRYVRAPDGVDLAYRVWPGGPADLVFVQAYTSAFEAFGEWPGHRRLVEGLASFARVVEYDGRGSGLSTHTGLPPAIEVRADDLRTIVETVAMERPAIFAFADGAAVACLFAGTHPEKISSLCLYAPTVRTSWAEDFPWGTREDASDEFRARIWEMFTTPEPSPELMGLLSGDLGPAGDDPSFRRYWARSLRYLMSPAEFEAFDRIWMDTDVRPVLPALRVPTVILHRSHPAEEGAYEAVRARIPGATRVELPGTEFMPIIGDIDAVVDAVAAHLRVVRPAPDLDRVLASILFIDIVDSTRLAADLGDAEWKRRLAAHDDASRDALARFGGSFVHSTGDGLLATFDGPARAVRCAQSIADAIRPLRLQIRAGVHTGEVERRGDDVQGLAVHIGARVAAMAGPNDVLVSRTVKDLVAGSGLAFEDAGEHELKGVPDRWRLYRVVA